MLAVEQPKGYNDSYSSTMACKTFVAREVPAIGILAEREEHLNPVFTRQVVARLVEEAVPQSRSGKDSNEDVYQQRVEVFLVDPLALEHVLGQDDIAKQKSEEEAERIPAQPESADVEDHGVHVPVYHI